MAGMRSASNIQYKMVQKTPEKRKPGKPKSPKTKKGPKKPEEAKVQDHYHEESSPAICIGKATESNEMDQKGPTVNKNSFKLLKCAWKHLNAVFGVGPWPSEPEYGNPLYLT